MAKTTVNSTAPEPRDEMDEIMSEIEELQQTMNQAEKPAVDLKLVSAFKEGAELEAEPDHSDLDGFKGDSGEAPLEETLGSLKEESPSGRSLLDEPKSAAGADGTLAMTLTGKMNLKLKYEFDGQEVTVGFDDHMLCVELSDGTEFRIPVRKKKSA